MNTRSVMMLLLAMGLIGWWQSPLSPRTPKPSALASSSAAMRACRLPPRVARGAAPLQTEVPSDLPAITLDRATVRPLAGFSIEARVLGREDYRSGREADFSPTDLALGWGRMRDDSVLAGLDISQSSRWYRYRWQDAPPIPVEEIIRSSANMHMIPANDDVAAALHRIEPDDRVRIDGWLVQVDADDGWRWRSSLSRKDSGGGACEVVYVCAITAE